jgi:hypothetical protein
MSDVNASQTFLSFFILDGGHLPFFLRRLLRTSRLRRCLNFLASFIRALCPAIIVIFDSSGISSILTTGFTSSGCPSLATLPSAAAWTRTGLFSVRETQLAVTFRGLGSGRDVRILHCGLAAGSGRDVRILHCSLAAETTVRKKGKPLNRI